jgi:hypothetical protein
MKLDPSIFALKYYQRLEDMLEGFINTVQILFLSATKTFFTTKENLFSCFIRKKCKRCFRIEDLLA